MEREVKSLARMRSGSKGRSVTPLETALLDLNVADRAAPAKTSSISSNSSSGSKSHSRLKLYTLAIGKVFRQSRLPPHTQRPSSSRLQQFLEMRHPIVSATGTEHRSVRFRLARLAYEHLSTPRKRASIIEVAGLASRSVRLSTISS